MDERSTLTKMAKTGLVSLGTVVIVAMVVIPALMYWGNLETKETGPFGDSYGVVNTLFSGIAVVGIVWAILLQREEIISQREDLKHQREEMVQQKLAIKKQNFESSFFQFLRMLEEKYNSVEYQAHIPVPDNVNPCDVKDDYNKNEVYHEVSGPIEIKGETFIITKTKGHNAFIQAHLENDRASISISLNSYFLLLLSALQFVDESDFIQPGRCSEKKFYIDILRSRLTIYETILLCIMAAKPEWWVLGGEETKSHAFKKLIEKYSLFSDILVTGKHEDYIPCYDLSAFGDSRRDIIKVYFRP